MLQVDNEFQQVKKEDLNDKFNVTIFTTSLSGGKAFAAEQKIRELKSRISTLRGISDKQKAKIPAVTIIKQSTENMNNVKSEKYSISPNVIEEKCLSSQRFRTLFNFERIERSKNVSDRLHKYDRKRYTVKKKKIHNILEIDEKVLALAERIRKSAPEKFYKQTFQNIPYFNKKAIFTIRKQNIDKKMKKNIKIYQKDSKELNYLH